MLDKDIIYHDSRRANSRRLQHRQSDCVARAEVGCVAILDCQLGSWEYLETAGNAVFLEGVNELDLRYAERMVVFESLYSNLSYVIVCNSSSYRNSSSHRTLHYCELYTVACCYIYGLQWKRGKIIFNK